MPELLHRRRFACVWIFAVILLLIPSLMDGSEGDRDVAIPVGTPRISTTYQQFVKAKEKGTESILPDFSYAGYHYSNEPVPDVAHPIFDVTKYGAIPNDDLSDQRAIQAAIAAAEANGKGVGHYAIKSQGSYGIWVGLSEDLANQLHGVGMSHSTTGNVVYRFDMGSRQSLDIHKTKPSYANLYDRVSNGRLYGSSGTGVQPHHLRRLVFWNFNHGGDDTRYDFWQGYLRFLHPIIVGFHGNPATFNESALEVLESNGSPVEPESLFEAQLALRLGKLPVWLNTLRTEWESLRKIPLPK